MKLVADVGHGRLVHDPAVGARVRIGVDNRDEVRLVDTRAFVKTGHIEKPLRRRLAGLGGRRVKGTGTLGWLLTLVIHRT
jgi:hypothetical protein